MKIIVSMTSWSKRIKQAEATVKSLLEQTRKPDSVELNLDLENFPHGIPDLPRWVMEYREKYPNFKVYFRGDDLKVYAKIMPTIGRHIYDEYILVTADDDVSYPSTYLEEIENNMQDADWLCTRSDQFTMGQYMVYSSKVCEKFIQHIDRDFMKNVPLDDYGLYWIIAKYGFRRGKKTGTACEDRQVGYSFRRFFVNVEDESKLLDTSCGYPSEEFDKERKYLARI